MQHEVAEAQTQWLSAKAWLACRVNGSSTGVLVSRCNELLNTLPWQSRLKGVNGTTLDLASMLSNEMTEGRVVDMMMDEVGNRIREQENLTHLYEALTLDFMDYVNRAWTRQGLESNTMPRLAPFLQNHLRRWRTEPKILVFPAHLTDKWHYVGVTVDTPPGDSLLATNGHKQLPQAIGKPLKWLLATGFGYNFEDVGAWTRDRAAYERALWFHRLSLHHTLG